MIECKQRQTRRERERERYKEGMYRASKESVTRNKVAQS